MPDIAEQLNRLQAVKNDIAAAIKSKGGIVTAYDGFEKFGGLISNISDTYALLHVTTNAGATVTVSKSERTLPQQTCVSDEVLVFNIPEAGTWTIIASKDGISRETTVSISERIAYYITANYYSQYAAYYSAYNYQRSEDAALFTSPVIATSNESIGSSPFDNRYPWSEMKVCYKDDNILVRIPKFYYSGNCWGYCKISDAPFSGSLVSPAHADRGDGQGERDWVYVGRYLCDSNGKSKSGSTVASMTCSSLYSKLTTGYFSMDLAMWRTILILFSVEFCSHNFHDSTFNYTVSPTGFTDNMAYHTGYPSSTYNGAGRMYRYIESINADDVTIEGIYGNLLTSSDSRYAAKCFMIYNPDNLRTRANPVQQSTPICTGYDDSSKYWTKSWMVNGWNCYSQSRTSSVSNGDPGIVVPDYMTTGALCYKTRYRTESFGGGLWCLHSTGGSDASRRHRLMYLPRANEAPLPLYT